ncbi:hypothetical protein Tco_1081965 [Tanacetum coccineum]|uniref:Uncharacterized protein n=1 Tax=Tanacetum coccineum TaxID=301880 RepID=A0ABQ5I0J1_9ASTR
MGRDTIQLKNAISTISQEYLLEFTSEYGIPEDLHLELPGSEDTIMDFSKGKVDERIFPTAMDWRTSAPKDGMPLAGSYSAADVAALDTNQMDLFGLICNPNPFKVKTGTRPRAAHEVPLLTATASRVIGMEDTTVASGSSGTPSTIEKLSLDFDNENPTPSTTEGVGVGDQAQDGLAHEVPLVETTITTKVVQEPVLEKVVAAMGPPMNKRRRHRGTDEAEANALPKVLRKDHATPHLAQKTSAGAKSVSDPDLLSYARPPPHSEQDVAQSSKGKATEILPQYVATTEACQDMVDHTVPPGYFSELRHLPNTEFLGQYNMNLARQVARGSQLRLRFEQEVRTVETEVHGLRNRTQNLETLLEAEVDMKKVVEAKNVDLAKVLESLCAQFFDLQVNNNQLSQQVSNLQAWQPLGNDYVDTIKGCDGFKEAQVRIEGQD